MPDILFVVSFPPKMHSSARFRIELYETSLAEKNITYDTEYFWNSDMYITLYKPGNTFIKIKWLLLGFVKRLWLLTKVRSYSYIFVLREATPIGPPVFEWICTHILKKKLIYDFDDAIWIEQASKSNAIVKFVKAVWKVKHICKWAYKVSVGNRYLYDYASVYNKHVVLNPTCVDTERKHNTLKDQSIRTDNIVIGWTGSFSTLEFLDEIVAVLQELEKKYHFSFLVIADQDPALPLKNYIFKKWEEDTEIEDLLQCNIGLMPLIDSEFTKGKCGFKIIQFLSLGIPVVASPIGVNAQIIDEKVDGFLCQSKAEWFDALEKLLTDTELRTSMGKAGRQKIEEKYSERSNRNNFLSLFQ